MCTHVLESTWSSGHNMAGRRPPGSPQLLLLHIHMAYGWPKPTPHATPHLPQRNFAWSQRSCFVLANLSGRTHLRKPGPRARRARGIGSAVLACACGASACVVRRPRPPGEPVRDPFGAWFRSPIPPPPSIPRRAPSLSPSPSPPAWAGRGSPPYLLHPYSPPALPLHTVPSPASTLRRPLPAAILRLRRVNSDNSEVRDSRNGRGAGLSSLNPTKG